MAFIGTANVSKKAGTQEEPKIEIVFDDIDKIWIPHLVK